MSSDLLHDVINDTEECNLSWLSIGFAVLPVLPLAGYSLVDTLTVLPVFFLCSWLLIGWRALPGIRLETLPTTSNTMPRTSTGQ